MSSGLGDTEVRPSRLPLVCPPPRLAADTRAKRVVALAFEGLWSARHGTNAIIRRR